MKTSSPIRDRDGVRPATFLWLACLFGLLAALAQIAYHSLERLLGWRWYLRLTPDFVWMTPVVDLVIFAVPGLAFFALAHVFTPRRCLPPALLVFNYLFFAKVLLLVGNLSPLAMALLNLGLAVQATRMLARHWDRSRPVLQRALRLSSAVIVALAGSHWAGELVGRGNEPTAAPQASAPNVIIITLDTVRAQNLSLHGYARNTSPHLAALASKGAWFENARVPAPWTLPSHASMFTGRYPHQLTAHWRSPLDDTFPTLAEVLRDRGYDTAGFVANRCYAAEDSGLARGFAHYEDYTRSLGEFVNCSALSRWFFQQPAVRHMLGYYDAYGRKSAAEVNEAFLGWLGGRDGRPFFAFLNYFDAHDPYLPPPPYDAMFGPPACAEDRLRFSRWWHSPPAELPRATIDAAVNAYDGAIAYLDAQLQSLFQELEHRGLLHNTLIVITSDHGEHFGEHNRYIHGNSLYRQLLNVPLVIHFPGRVPAGTRVAAPVTLRDLPATVLALVGADDAPLPGYTLSRFWDPSVPRQAESPLFHLAVAFPARYIGPDHGRSGTATGCIVSLIDGGKHYLRYTADDREELFDVATDPWDTTNLADRPEHRALLESMRVKVLDLFREHPSFYLDLPGRLATAPRRPRLEDYALRGECCEAR